jgi:hypothetical protein
MKTLTEFSALTLRKAAEARAAAGGATVGTPAAELDDAMDASERTSEEAPGDASDDATPRSEENAEAGPPEATADSPAADAPVEQKPDPIRDAIASALGVQPDRAARLIEALDIVGNRLDEVRLVRV